MLDIVLHVDAKSTLNSTLLHTDEKLVLVSRDPRLQHLQPLLPQFCIDVVTILLSRNKTKKNRISMNKSMMVFFRKIPAINQPYESINISTCQLRGVIAGELRPPVLR